MNKLILFALLGVVAADRFGSPSRSYGPPSNGNGRSNGNGGYSNGGSNGFNGNGNGGSNGFSNGYSAPSNGGSNGFSNGGSNGYSNGGSNGFSNGGSNGFSNGGRNGYSNGGRNGNGLSSAYGAPGAGSDPLADLAENIPGGGVPGQDFPVLAFVPDTGFECGQQAVSGYYADTAQEAGCQVFHICQLRESGLVQQDSFLCPNGTIFNQQYFVCDWWFNFDCSSAQDFYSLNEQIGVAPNGGSNGGYGASSSLSSGYGAPSNGNGFSNGRSNGNGYSNGGSNGNGNGNGYSNGRSNGNGRPNGNGNGYSNGGRRNGNGFSGYSG